MNGRILYEAAPNYSNFLQATFQNSGQPTSHECSDKTEERLTLEAPVKWQLLTKHASVTLHFLD